MQREIDNHLINWKKSENRKPLILRGARQIGKTTSVRKLGKAFKNFIEINFEFMPKFNAIFEADLDSHRIISDIQFVIQQPVIPGETLLFFDEAPAVPRVLIALRYFYELIPELHVIAAGSLLDFAIEQVGLPVGRIQILEMHPMSYKEFLWAMGNHFLVDGILNLDPNKPFNSAVHDKGLRLFSEYIAVGGLPEAVACWRDKKNYSLCLNVHHDLIRIYKQDFEKYAKKPQIQYVDHVFSQVSYQLGEQFNYAKLSGEFRKRELEPALRLLEKANVITKIIQTPARGIPLGANINPSHFKVIMLDVALTQALLGHTSEQWILDIENEFVNKGAIAEAFIGQELLAYSNPRRENNLYYWRRNQHGSEAEIDYIVARDMQMIPIEVKAGKGSTLKSMHLFLQEHPEVPYGIRFSTQNFSRYEKIISYPLYAAMCLI